MSISVILLFLAGLVLVVLGSDYLVDGSSAIARRSGISEFVIGLTIVGIGTSTPEMVVSFIGAINGNGDISIGNIIGSNIFNTFLILGVTAVILPMTITDSVLKKDIPLNIAATLVLILLGMKYSIFGIGEDCIGRFGGVIMLALFAGYMFSCFRSKAESCQENNEDGPVKDMGIAKAVILVVLGLAALIGGGRLFVKYAIEIAHHLGWSDKFISITVLAGGTSMPELATCVVAAIKKKGQLALGNIIGSNISNILLILGGSAIINPLSFAGISSTDLGFVFLASVFLLAAAFTFDKRKLDRSEGVALLLCEAIYMYLLISEL